MATPPRPPKETDPSKPGYYPPSQTALLLLDFHSAFIHRSGTPDAPNALKTATKLRTWAKSHNIHVIHCLIDVHQAPFATCKDAGKLSSIIDGMKSDNSSTSTNTSTEPFHNPSTDLTFTRQPGLVSALTSPGLEPYLRDKGVSSLILAGLSTSGCVLRTAVGATDARFVVTVVRDGCADRRREVHEVSLEIVASRAYVESAGEVMGWFGGGGGGGGDVEGL